MMTPPPHKETNHLLHKFVGAQGNQLKQAPFEAIGTFFVGLLNNVQSGLVVIEMLPEEAVIFINNDSKSYVEFL